MVAPLLRTMLILQVFGLTAVLLSFANAQGDDGQYTWTPSTTEDWGEETTTTDDWSAVTTTDDSEPVTTTPEYDWTSYTTVTSCYTENGLIITTTTWVPCPCDDNGGTVTTDPYPIGTTTQTLTTTTTPAYSTFTSNGIVYVDPISTPITATASAGVQIVNASDASKATEIEGWTLETNRSPDLREKIKNHSDEPTEPETFIPESQNHDLHLHPHQSHPPRILCLHGGGVNARIFRAQFRAILSSPLSAKFRFVFIDAPFPCEEGVGVVPVYADWGPFRRWFRWLETHEAIDAKECREEIQRVVREGMEGDEGTGGWVGVLGFSQGAKLAASLLFERQVMMDEKREREGDVKWQFAVILAGRAPLVALSETTEGLPWMQSAGGIADGVDLESINERPEMRLRLPTVQVHGLKDEGLYLHRRLVDGYCAPGSVTLVEWDGGHRLPLKKADVEKVVQAVLELCEEYGI